MLVDTSVWIDHLRRGNAALSTRLTEAMVLAHPFVVGELASGNLGRRSEVISLLAALPQAPTAEHEEALNFIQAHRLMGTGIGWVDVHLLVSAKLAGTVLWTLDRRLQAIAQKLGVSA